ncbi:probable G-protein coupled receptor 148 [Gadus morhua]|nr:probable G-protein coupled receptor 148 [Gadus morhua]
MRNPNEVVHSGYQEGNMDASIKLSNLTQEWFDSLQGWRLQFFFIPATLVTLITFATNPVLLTCIFLSRALRQETRYLLVANTLAADLLFLTLNLATVFCNALGVHIPPTLCQLDMVFIVTAYCCAILTVTVMVADTYAAVRWPLHYRELLPPARTVRILVGLWVVAALYPLSMWIMMETTEGNASAVDTPICLVLISLGFIQATNMVGVHIYFCAAALVCTLLIVYCYVRLYMVTKTQGIWQSRYSRARVTLLAHGVLLLLYFVPGLVFTVELFLFQQDDVSQDARVWINTINMCILMLLPRAFAPCLYGLRYREISDTLVQLLHRRRRLCKVTGA